MTRVPMSEDPQQEQDGEQKPPEGGLGILFFAAALALAVLLGGIGLFAYLVMSR
jgi:hypothetical protein